MAEDAESGEGISADSPSVESSPRKGVLRKRRPLKDIQPQQRSRGSMGTPSNSAGDRSEAENLSPDERPAKRRKVDDGDRPAAEGLFRTRPPVMEQYSPEALLSLAENHSKVPMSAEASRQFETFGRVSQLADDIGVLEGRSPENTRSRIHELLQEKGTWKAVETHYRNEANKFDGEVELSLRANSEWQNQFHEEKSEAAARERATELAGIIVASAGGKGPDGELIDVNKQLNDLRNNGKSWKEVEQHYLDIAKLAGGVESLKEMMGFPQRRPGSDRHSFSMDKDPVGLAKDRTGPTKEKGHHLK